MDQAIFRSAVEAAQNRDLARLAILLEAHPDLINAREHRDDGSSGLTLLHSAVGGKNGDDASAPDRVEVVEYLISAGANVHAAVGDGATPLHFAATMNMPRSVQALIRAGASLVAEDAGAGGTPLAQALFHGCPDTADILAAHAIVPLNLRVAAGLGRIDLLESLFYGDELTPQATAARAFYRTHDGFPEWRPSDDPREVVDEALVYAAHNGRLAAVDWLLARGANVNGMPYFASALHFASYRGHREIVERLFAAKADLSLVDRKYGGTAADWARHGGHPEIVEIFDCR